MLELLAPAGSMEALRAAVQNGANAVYLGCGQFNARQSAKNFTPQTLTEAVKQKVIVQLHSKISNLMQQLKIERERNQRNEEMIRLLQAQIDDLMLTMEVAENAKTA